MTNPRDPLPDAVERVTVLVQRRLRRIEHVVSTYPPPKQDAAREHLLHGAELDCYMADVTAILSALSARDAEIERLRGALEPFAQACEDADDETASDTSNTWEAAIGMCITFGDFRRARAALLHQVEGESSRETI